VSWTEETQEITQKHRRILKAKQAEIKTRLLQPKEII
jgi:hypothetical protein